MTPEQESILEFRRGENPHDDDHVYKCVQCGHVSKDGLDMSPTESHGGGDICNDDKACKDRTIPERHQCNCGSKKWKEAQYDGHGLFLTYTCEDCHAKKMSGFRQDIHEFYDAEENIYEDMY